MSKQDYLQNIKINNKDYQYYSLKKLQENLPIDIQQLPYSLTILLENLLRNYDNINVTNDDLLKFQQWLTDDNLDTEITFKPTRILLQDFTGVPAVVDLAAMRNKIQQYGQDPKLINPVIPVDLVIDHSIQVDEYGNNHAMDANTKIEVLRNKERYQLLKWAQNSFNNFRVVPPGTGICHQVNLEYFAKVIWQDIDKNNNITLFPDTLVGTDSHTTMINGLGVLGWGVGGIEAESAMLAQPIPMILPKVVGVEITGKLNEGITATDLVLTITNMLRTHGVVGKFVEFYGDGLKNLSLADRATIANMAPEYGATCGYFPIDEETLNYLEFTNRSAEEINIVAEYAKAQGLWLNNQTRKYSENLRLDLATIEPTVAGPYRPQDQVAINKIPQVIKQELSKQNVSTNQTNHLQHGDVVIAAITSCTNTSNPHILIAAGLLAKNAIERGLTVKPWVKTSLAPGSKVVSDYLAKTGLQTYLDQLGFNLVAYGCTTCIGNSGPLAEEIQQEITTNKLLVSSVLSGNRNFTGRINPHTKFSWLASPPLVIAYALAGTMNIDLTKESLGLDHNSNQVYLRDLWPTSAAINEQIQYITKSMFAKEYANVFAGDHNWKSLSYENSVTYNWDANSTYIKHPSFLQEQTITNINEANILAIFGDSITTDHISPAGNIPINSPAGEYLLAHNIQAIDFNSYGTRRGNHEVMIRGTFSNIRIQNEMLDNIEGGYTKHYPSNEQMSIFAAASKYQKTNTPLIIIAGKEYGTGSSRDWAAKGTRMLGVKAVIAESYERIHRSNLIGMGVLPLQFINNNRKALQLTGAEIISIKDIENLQQPKSIVTATIKYPDNTEKSIELLARIDTKQEVHYFRANGILNYVLNNLPN